MIRKHISGTVLLLVFVDQLVLVASLAVSLWLKASVILADPELPVWLHIDLFLHLWPFLALSLAMTGAYKLQVAVGGLRPLFRRTLISAAVLGGVWIAGTFYLKMTSLFEYSRGVFTLFLFFSAIGLVGVRLGLAEIVNLYRIRTDRYKRILVFGGEALGQKLIDNLQNQVFASVSVVEVTGHVDMPGVIRFDEEQALRRVRQGEVDLIIVDLPPRRIRLLLHVARLAEREGIPLQITPTIFPGLHLSPRVDRIGDVPIMELTGGDRPLPGLLAKRILDLVCSAVGLLLLSPLLIAIGVAIRLTSRGPALYWQDRVGLDGRRFRILKFRTMHVDAERETGPVWAVDNDPRATRVGRFLRRHNFDELPQLFNVLTGKMSLVGPRPERPEFVEQFKHLIDRYSHKHWVKPGITGWAQVNGWRGRTDLNRRIQHDIYYVEHWSLWLDVKILLLTSLRLFKPAEGNLEALPPEMPIPDLVIPPPDQKRRDEQEAVVAYNSSRLPIETWYGGG